MARTFNTNLYPAGGRVFTDGDGTFFRGSSWKALIAKVTEYRKGRGAAVGDVWAEIQAQICGKMPGFCHESRPLAVTAAGSMTFNQRIVHWLAWALGQKRVNATSRISAEEAARRAEICVRCPQQHALNASCGACIRSIEQSRTVILDGKRSAHLNLHGCAVLGEDCPTSVHLNLPPSDNPALPGNCWRKA